MVNDPDHFLVDEVIAGNQRVFSLLIDKHKRYAFTLAMKILQHKAEAEEATQDAFVKAYHHLRDFNKQAKFSTWLYRIVFNTAISYKRKNRYIHQSLDTVNVKHEGQGEDNLENRDKKKYLDQALSLLSIEDRASLSLFYLQEFSLEEIATITGVQANTMKVRIHRARIKLAEELKTILNKEALTL